MPTDDREQQFERALSRHLENASPHSRCPDAETLAAYHERTLSLEEMARWKEHLAACPRCQETLGLVEQTEDVPVNEWREQEMPAARLAGPAKVGRPAASGRRAEPESFSAAPPMASPIRPHLPWRWVVPVGAVAAAVIVWVGVRESQIQQRRQAESVEMAKNQAPLAPAISSAVDQLHEPPQKQELQNRAFDQSLKEQESRVLPSRKTSSPGESPSRQGAPGPSSSTPKPAAPEAAATEQKDLVIAGRGGAASANRAVAAPMALEAPRGRDAERAPEPPAVSAATGEVTASVPAEDKKKERPLPAAESVTATSPSPPGDSSSVQLQLQNREVSDLMLVAGVDRRIIVSPGEKNVWRVGAAGKIEHSTDKGKSWKVQKNGVTTDLTAGSATSEKVCWVVGKAGTVLLTTDGGKHWKQIASPIAGDLGGIHATDALHASIWDVPNRHSYETADGGMTWDRTAND